MHNDYIHVYILCNICLMCGMSLELEVGDLYTWAQTLGGNWAWSTGSGGWDQRRASCYDIIIRLQEIYLVLRCTEIGLGVWSEFFCAGFWLVVMWRSRLCKHTRFTYNNHGSHAPTHTNQGRKSLPSKQREKLLLCCKFAIHLLKFRNTLSFQVFQYWFFIEKG